MIEFSCEYCGTDISIAPDQVGDEIFCPACEKQIHLPELPPSMQAKIAIAKAQAKNVPTETDHEKAEKMLQEPDSEETKVWKERLAQSFQSSCFKEYQEPETLKPEKEDKSSSSGESGIKKIFNIFSGNND